MENQIQTIETRERGLNLFDPQSLETIQRACKMFAYSELVPDMYKVSEKNPESKAIANCMIALDISNRMGASPLMVMQNLVIIYGRPSWSSKFLIATVNTCGRFNALQYEFTNLGKVGKITITTYEKKWVNGANGGKGYYANEAKQETFDGTALDNIQCICFTTEKGKSDVLKSNAVTIEMAIKEGWYTKAGSKWRTMPQQMLMYRSASFWTNAYAPELSMGMRTEDEIRDTESEVIESAPLKEGDAPLKVTKIPYAPKSISLSDLPKQQDNSVEFTEVKEEVKEESKSEMTESAPEVPEVSEQQAGLQQPVDMTQINMKF